MQEKTQLRSQIKSALKALSPDEHARRSSAACQQFLSSALYTRARTIFGYVSHRNELALGEILTRILIDGKTLALPNTGPNPASFAMSFHCVTDLTRELRPGRFGILEPSADSLQISPELADVILVPGVAFTPRGDRLGLGAGFYDRYLSRSDLRARRAALAFEFQIVESIPTEPHDCRVDTIFTDERTLCT